jgi:hypothetical protein
MKEPKTCCICKKEAEFFTSGKSPLGFCSIECAGTYANMPDDVRKSKGLV